MNEKTTIRFVLTGVKYSQSDLGKHYKTFCGLYRDPDVRHVKTRVSCNALPYLRVFFQPSVVSFLAHAHIL